MISRTNFTRKIVIVSAIALGLLPSHPANAADFKIGNVKQEFPTDSLCVSFNPKMPDKAILVDLENSSWININGKDIELKYVSHKNVNNKRFVRKFQGHGFTVTIDRRTINVQKGAMLQTSDAQEVITIKRGNQSKLLKVKGYCST